jgi:hypothetical protein
MASWVDARALLAEFLLGGVSEASVTMGIGQQVGSACRGFHAGVAEAQEVEGGSACCSKDVPAPSISHD